MTTRRAVLAIGGIAGLIPATANGAPPAAIEEWTFLKSLDADPSALVRFIEANWFAMDARAVAAGLMTGFAVHVAEGDGEWNVVVVVRYPDTRGYAGIAPAFEAIRAAHISVAVDGKTLKQLGTIIGMRRVRAGHSKARA